MRTTVLRVHGIVPGGAEETMWGLPPAPIHPLMIGTEQHYFLCCMDKTDFVFLLVFNCLNTVLGKRPEGITENPSHVVMESYLSSPLSPTVGEEDPGRRALLSE